MEKRKSPRVPLVKSLLCTVLCLGLLVGTTFAWFSDEAGTGDTTITAGNLAVELHKVGEDGSAVGDLIGESEQLFNIGEDFLWEPGAMWTSGEFYVVNAGNLALWYELKITGTDDNPDDEVNLLDVIEMKVVNTEAEGLAELVPQNGATAAERAAFWEAISSTEGVEAKSGVLLPKDAVKPDDAGADVSVEHSGKLQAVLYWPPHDSTATDPKANPDNKYNLNNGQEGALSATFSLDVFATQTPFEEDSFGKDYDIDPAAQQKLNEELQHAGPDDPVDLPEGYTVISEEFFEWYYKNNPGADISFNGKEGEDNVLHIIPTETGAGITTEGNLTLKNVTIDATDGIRNNAAILAKAGEVYLENVTIVGGGDGTWGSSVETFGATKLTVKNCHISGAYRALFIESGNAEILVEDCVLEPTAYTINIGDSFGSRLTVRNSILRGWTSYSHQEDIVNFENVTFESNGTYNFLRPYSDTVLTNCTLGDDFRLSFAVGGIEVDFKGCHDGDGL